MFVELETAPYEYKNQNLLLAASKTVMTKVGCNWGSDNNVHDDISRGKWCFLSIMGCHGLDEVPLNSPSVPTVSRPDAGQSGVFCVRVFMSSLLSSRGQGKRSMEESPAIVKVDRGENQMSPCRGRRCFPKALSYVTGDMKEFANWLKGIYTSMPWRDMKSGFGRN